MQRCPWPYLEKSAIYQDYHDNEWGKPNHNDQALFEKLSLEIFQAGLSWLTILKKRDYFRKVFDDFDIQVIVNYQESKIQELMNDVGIVRNRSKIEAIIHNASIIFDIIDEFGSFDRYVWSFSKGQILMDESLEDKQAFSNNVWQDFKKRGFQRVGKVTTYSFLESVGVMNNHHPDCYLNSSSNKM